MSRVVTAAFFVSGFTALVLEVVWSRMLVYVFGTTELALSTVLTAYMAGLALGSWLAGRFADRLRRPEVWYAVCEAGIGLAALAIPWVIELYPVLYRVMWTELRSSLYVFSLVRFGLVFATLIVPTTLMGATLPLLARFIAEPTNEEAVPEAIRAVERRNARRTGFLYSANLLGACCGTAAAGLALLPSLGIALSNASAAVADLLLACLVGVWAWRAGPQLVAARSGGEAEPADDVESSLADLMADATDAGDAPADAPLLDASGRALVLTAFAFGGAAAMTYQVLWTRTLSLAIGSSTYAFTLILLCFLIGLGLGSLWASRRVGRMRRPARALALAHGAIAAACALMLLFADRLPRLFMVLVHGSDLTAETVMLVMFVTVSVPLLLPTFAMGTIFPLTIRLIAPRAESIGKDVGNAYAWNTVGAIVGSFASGFVIIVTLGLQRGLLLTAAVSATIGAFVWLYADRPPGARIDARRHLTAAGAIVGAVVLVALVPPWDIGRLTEGLFRLPLAKHAYGAGYLAPDEILFHAEGMTTTVTVERNDEQISLKVNGKVDASSGGDMPSQIFAGALGLLFHPETMTRPLDVLIIGYGSGVSAGAALQFPIASLQVVEIEREVFNAGHFFRHVNHDPPSDPRFRLEVNDGRNYLFATPETFDVIVSVPSNPWIAGVSSLFTTEYVQMVRAHLRPRGVYIQWLQLYEISADRVRTIMRTVVEQFPHVQILTSEALSTDLFLICSDGPLPLDLRAFGEKLADPTIAAELGRANVKTTHDLIARYMMSRRDAEIFFTGAPVNTDDNLYLEFSAPRDLFTASRERSASGLFYDSESYFGRILENLDWYGADAREVASNYGELALSLLRNGRSEQSLTFIRLSRAGGSSPGAERAALIYALLEAEEGQILPFDERIMAADPPSKDSPEIPALYRNTNLYDLLRTSMRRGDWDGALALLVEMDDHFTDGPMYNLVLGYIQHTRMRWVSAMGALKRAVDESGDGPADVHVSALYYLSRTYWYFREYPDAYRSMNIYVDRMATEHFVLPPGVRETAARIGVGPRPTP